MKTITIKTNQHQYPLVIGAGIYDKLPHFLKKAGINFNKKIMIVTDDNVAQLYLNKINNALKDYNVSSYIVQAGEYSKTLEQTENIIQYAIEQGLDRSSVILALGGGVVGDLAGFVSAIYMRGITFIQIPTTILAHDSSVGGKVAVNHELGKNLIGAFHQPNLVFYDTSFLTSLPEREIRAGLAEVIKHGLIADENFSAWLFENADKLLQLNLDYVNVALLRGIEVKADIVKVDEKEQGIRAILNYGHTLAHVIETISDYRYLHGEAVAIGMVFASKVAHRLDLIPIETVNYTIELIKKYRLPTSIPKDYDTNQMIDIMMKDKKFNNNQIRMVLPIKNGSVTIRDEIDKLIVYELIEELKIQKH